MELTLSSIDVARYEAAAEALLSPSDYPDPSAWCTAVLRRIERLFHADRSMLVLPNGDGVRIHSDNIPPAGMRAFHTVAAAVNTDSPHPTWNDFDAVLQTPRTSPLPVWYTEDIMRHAGISDVRPFYHEVMVPSGIAHGSGMVASAPQGDAWLGVACSHPADARFDTEAGLQMLRLLFPAFRAGVYELLRLTETRDALTDAAGVLGRNAAAYDLDAREVWRSDALDALLTEEPESERVMAAMRTAAQAVAGLRSKRAKSTPNGSPPGQLTVATASSCHRIRATLVAPGLFGRDGGVLVVLERNPELPTPAELRARYRLTPREAEVALLLAAGASDLDLAKRLTISPHTVRTHTERIYRKLGIHSRKGLALRFLAGMNDQ